MTDLEKFEICSYAYLIPKKYYGINCNRDFLQSAPELLPAFVVRIGIGSESVELYTGGVAVSNGALRDGFCQSCFVPITELSKYRVTGNNKLETFIQRRSHV